ncbi:hypothetical protein TNCV_386541 [Trichonephila clavipes]|nr:hypothetical protein TNCV_386541 [Trichonephila clavipes]
MQKQSQRKNNQFFKSDANLLAKIQSFKYRIQQQYSQGKYPKVFTPSTAIKHKNSLKTHVRKDYSHKHSRASQNDPHYLLAESRLLAIPANILFICATETSRNITARVIERDTSGEIYHFLEDSRGFRTHQQGRQ